MYRFTKTQKIAAPLSEVWTFFSKPANLQELMPADMSFKILDQLPDDMYPGLVLRYKVSPLLGIPLSWTSEITAIEPDHFFIDKQVEGPFRYWQHEHRFEENGSGTLVTDILHYKLPFEPVGKLFHGAIVRSRLENIFAEREAKTAAYFSKRENDKN